MEGSRFTGRPASHRRSLSLRRHGLAVGFGLALVVTACGGADSEDGLQGAAATAGNDGSGTTYSVGVDASTDQFNAAFLRFFPDRLTVHPGDRVVFQRPENGEPHTVTIGSSVPDVDPRGAGGTEFGGNFFEGGFGGPPRRDNSMPCFLAEATPPGEGCSSAEQEPVPFDGTQSWFNSGGLLGEEEYALDLSDTIAAGEYSFVCLVHTSTMKGTIEVVGPGQPADDPANVEARGDEELEREVGLVAPRVETGPSLLEGQVAAALADTDQAAWAAIIFAPEEIEVPVGGTVTWRVMGDHTISFNAPEGARPFYERAEDGSVRENEEAAEPRGDFDEWDGTGFLNSGLRSGFFPPDEFSVTFASPGTYPYQCLVHFDMEGKVKVGG
jgi:plastocyanin